MSATIDVAGLLQRLLEQQTALLQAHGESLRIQRLLVEHLLGTGRTRPRPTRETQQPGWRSLRAT